jgi:hypothetical protein
MGRHEHEPFAGPARRVVHSVASLAFDRQIPAAHHIPRLRPPASVFPTTTAKSGPGISTTAAATARNAT